MYIFKHHTAFPRVFFVLLLFAALALPCPKSSEAASPGDHQIKAAMVFNMMRFVEWPESSFSGSDETIDICIIGRGAMSTAVEALSGKQLKGKNIAVRQVGKHGTFSGCHVLVLSDTDRASISSILDTTRSAPVITVGDSRGFASSGGVFGFMILDGKVRFEINLASAQRHRLRISAQLLKLAQNVLE